MATLRKKIALFFLGLFTLITVVSQLPPPVRAQCPTPLSAADQPFCDTAKLTCVPGMVLDNFFHKNYNFCVAVVFDVGRALFSPPPPEPWYNPDLQSFAQKVFDTSNPDEIFGERYTYAQVNWIVNSLIVFFFPPIAAHDAQELFLYLAQMANIVNAFRHGLEQFNNLNASINVLPKYGFIGQTYFVMAKIPKLIFTSNIASGVREVGYVAGKLNLFSPAYAQGLGYDKLGLGGSNNTIRNLWIASRNLAYLISTVILIAAGFMVIFRTKISPQASVTVQMIIPRLAISLILVTFSFAIAGFVIDLLYVLITAILGFIYFSQGVVGVQMITDLNQAVTELTGPFDFVGHFLGIYIAIALILLVVTVVLTIVAAWFTLGAASVIAPLLGIIMGFFMWSVYVWVRILGQLIVAYITLILLVIAGPVMIILDILPTSKGGFKKWLLCVAGNASVFGSYSIFAILTSFLFTPGAGGPIPGFADTSGGSPQISATFILPNFANGTNQGWLLKYFIFIGFMSAIPNFVNSIKNTFCKSDDLGSFLENTVKDTIGQFTRAGENAGRSVGELRAQQLKGSVAEEEVVTKQAGGTGGPTGSAGGPP